MVLIKTKKPCLNSHLLLQKWVIHCLNLFLKGPFKIKIMRKKRKEKEISKLIYIPHILRVFFFFSLGFWTIYVPQVTTITWYGTN